MHTRVLSPDAIGEAAGLLLQRELVAFPTETVYGLGALLASEEAIARLFSAKRRPADNPLIAHVSSIEMGQEIADWSAPDALQLARLFWPGPLTLVLPKKGEISPLATAGLETIALRLPAHPVAQALIEAVGQPLVAPSANLSGRPSPTEASHVLEDLEGAIAAVVDGGVCPLGIESTVIALLDGEALLLRPGSLPAGTIEEALGKPLLRPAQKEGEPPLSPGMRHRHYAPKAAVRLISSKEEAPAGDPFILSAVAGEGLPLSGASLYQMLRRADREGRREIFVVCDEKVKQDEALMNRLQKAADYA